MGTNLQGLPEASSLLDDDVLHARIIATADDKKLTWATLKSIMPSSDSTVYDISDGVDIEHELPDATLIVKEQFIKRTGAGTGKVLFTGTGIQTIDGILISDYELWPENDEVILIPIGENYVTKGGSIWHKIQNPVTGLILTSALSVSDNFTSGLDVDFTPYVPKGTKAVRLVVGGLQAAATYAHIYSRKSGDANISNTPHANSEQSSMLFRILVTGITQYEQVVINLSDDYKAEFTANIHTSLTVYITFPLEFLR